MRDLRLRTEWRRAERPSAMPRTCAPGGTCAAARNYGRILEQGGKTTVASGCLIDDLIS